MASRAAVLAGIRCVACSLGRTALLSELVRIWTTDPIVEATLSHIAGATGPGEIIDEVASVSRRMREQFADVIRVVLSTAPHDPGVAEQLAAATVVYRGAFVPVAERLAQLGALRPGTDAGHAVDVLWFYFGYSSYFTLHDDNGWTYQRAEHWLAGQARREFLCPPQAPAESGGPVT